MKIINFEVLNTDIDKTKEHLDDDSSTINPYFEKYKSHQFEIDTTGNIFFSKFFKIWFSFIKKFIFRSSYRDS